jgi:Mitochondrial ribosomal protein mL59
MKEEDTSLQGQCVEEVRLGREWRRKEETTGSVEWIGTVRERRVAGADIGARLYAGKKRMFKGHKWERERERRELRTKILLRDMDKRVQRFKQVRLTPFITRSSFVFVFFSTFRAFVFLGFSTALRVNRYRWRGGPAC